MKVFTAIIAFFFTDIFAAIFIQCTVSYRILLVAPPLPSHLMEMKAIGSELVKRGHLVYSVISSAFERKERVTNDAIIELEYRAPAAAKMHMSSTEWEKWLVDQAFHGCAYSTGKVVNHELLDECSSALDDEMFMNKARAIRFDFAVVDRFLVASCLYLIPHVLGVPYASSGSTFEPFMSGSPSLPSFSVPGGIFAYSDKMTFPQRVVNVLFHAAFMSLDFLIPGNNNVTLLQKHAPTLHKWRQLQDNAWLHFVSRDHILDFIKPNLPNIITTPAMNLKPAKTLMPQFEKIAESSKRYGMIIVSFGSMGVYLPQEIIQKLLSAFSNINQTIIIRLPEIPETEMLPPNVHFFPWIPQNDLLAHPNSRLFITHCGNNGQYEAIFHGIPMIGIPLWGDQIHNAFRVVDKKLGLMLNIRTFTREQLVDSINQIITDSRYQNNARIAAAMLRDAPMTPQETVAYWIEHVLRHGPSHLKSHLNDLPWYTYCCLDVYLTLLVLIFLTCIIVHKFMRRFSAGICTFLFVQLQEKSKVQTPKQGSEVRVLKTAYVAHSLSSSDFTSPNSGTQALGFKSITKLNYIGLNAK